MLTQAARKDLQARGLFPRLLVGEIRSPLPLVRHVVYLTGGGLANGRDHTKDGLPFPMIHGLDRDDAGRAPLEYNPSQTP